MLACVPRTDVNRLICTALCVLCLGFGGTLALGDVADEMQADALAESIISVSFVVQTGPSSYLSFPRDVILTPGPDEHQIVASSSGEMPWEDEVYEWAYEFTLTGETSTAAWTLTNTSPDDRVAIQSVNFFKAHGPLVFDDDSEPSTPGSGPGIDPAIHVSGPAITTSSYTLEWGNSINAGDLFTHAIVGWVELPNLDVFLPGTTAQFIIDTDQDLDQGGSLAATGSCPGKMTFTASDFSRFTNVAFLYSFGEGNQRVPRGSPYCGNLLLGLDRTFKLGKIMRADGNGTAEWTVKVPAAACGRVYMQAIDLFECQTTNVIGL